jgi:hypothetical protein
MLCGSHFCPFSPISPVEQWPQAKHAAIYRVNCYTRLLSAPTELELQCGCVTLDIIDRSPFSSPPPPRHSVGGIISLFVQLSAAMKSFSTRSGEHCPHKQNCLTYAAKVCTSISYVNCSTHTSLISIYFCMAFSICDIPPKITVLFNNYALFYNSNPLEHSGPRTWQLEVQE